jgi:hypothetical protein
MSDSVVVILQNNYFMVSVSGWSDRLIYCSHEPTAYLSIADLHDEFVQ